MLDRNTCSLRASITLSDCISASGQDTWVYEGATSTDWERYPGRNCGGAGGGEDWILPDGTEGELADASVEECIAYCDTTQGCVGFKRDGRKCMHR